MRIMTIERAVMMTTALATVGQEGVMQTRHQRTSSSPLRPHPHHRYYHYHYRHQH